MSGGEEIREREDIRNRGGESVWDGDGERVGGGIGDGAVSRRARDGDFVQGWQQEAALRM